MSPWRSIASRARSAPRSRIASIAHSPLVKTAFFASDPNLGRILAAVLFGVVALVSALLTVRGARGATLRENAR